MQNLLTQPKKQVTLSRGELLETLARLTVAGRRRSGPHIVLLSEREVRGLIHQCREALLADQACVHLTAPIRVIGDIHGQFHDLIRLLEHTGGYPCEIPGIPEVPVTDRATLFLGDYVDRGRFSIETICFCFCLKILFPQTIYLLRGNHETSNVNRLYGFYDDCKRRYNIKIWKAFSDAFNCLPFTALVEKKILCMHGGLSPELKDLDSLNQAIRPMEVPSLGLWCDLLWSDPEEHANGWSESDRGVSFVFGPDVVRDFAEAHSLDLICRAHQVVENGFHFFSDRRLVTIFSAPNYCGEFQNRGAALLISDALVCSFAVLKGS